MTIPSHRKSSNEASNNDLVTEIVVNNCVPVSVSWENLGRKYLGVKINKMLICSYELLLTYNFG